MTNLNQNDTISKTALRQYKARLKEKFALSFSFFVFAFACVTLGFVWPISLLLTVPLIIIPLFLCLQISNGTLRILQKEGLSHGNFFRFFILSFKRPFLGSYRVISSLLKAIAIGLIFYFVAGLVTYQILSMVDSSFSELMTKASELLANSDLDSAFALLQENPLYITCENILICISFGFFLLSFYHFIGVNSLNANLTNMMPGVNRGAINYVHKNVLRMIRKPFYKDYYHANYLGLVLYLFGYVGGVLISYQFTSKIDYICLSGTIGSLLLLFPFLPYYLDVNDLLFSKYINNYRSFALETAKKAYSELEKNTQVSQEEKEKLKEYIDDVNKEVEKTKNEDKK